MPVDRLPECRNALKYRIVHGARMGWPAYSQAAHRQLTEKLAETGEKPEPLPAIDSAWPVRQADIVVWLPVESEDVRRRQCETVEALEAVCAV